MINSNIKDNFQKFSKQYNFEKSNYNIILSGNDSCGKYALVERIISEYYQKNNFKLNIPLSNNPDILHLSLPIYDKSGKLIETISNKERLMYKFGFEKKINDNRVGTEITINQIREMTEFVSYSSRYNHKFIIINNIEDLNNEASAAFLKTLEETNSPTVFLLLNSEIDLVPETIKSRCHTFNFITNENNLSDSTMLEYFVSSKPTLREILEKKNYMEDYHLIENELHLLYEKKVDPIVLSEKWQTRGVIIIDYLISIFSILMKGRFIHDNSSIKKLYNSLSQLINITPSRSIKILTILLDNKKNLFYNLNQKFYFDNLLIVLNKNLY
ncbi:MAG: hypothetical protein VX440_00925 [Pseudomonadota bacterium]|nr:hypothetical protein [Pseudomonadota bacterium]|tara:strand:- start:2677 stop:3660 length:984 start_codon:yes stop_codon:yes gene_type:complete